MAAAYAARELGVPLEVVVPESTMPLMIARMRGLGATVTVHGAAWDDANDRAIAIVKERGESSSSVRCRCS